MNNKPSIGILGAGITGLSVAWKLKNQGISVEVYEKQAQLGGVIQTFQENDWMVEEGPNTMLVRDRKIWNFLDELDLREHIAKPGGKAKKRYIIRDGTPKPVPSSVFGFMKSDLISSKAKVRLLKEPFVKASQKDDESIASFIKRRLGTEPLDYAVDPFISGVYAGDPEKLSVKHTFGSLFGLEQNYGSITKGLLRRERKTKPAERALISFDEGLRVLPRAITQKLTPDIHLNTKVNEISYSQNEWKIVLTKNGETITRKHQALISTLPTHQLAKIWNEGCSKKIVSELQTIDYAPVSVLALGFQQKQIGHPLDGFGMLVPDKEPFSLMGCLFSSALFPRRAPENHSLLTCFIGGTRNPHLATFSSEDLVGEIMPQLRNLLDIKGDPVFQHHHYWEKAIPQYSVGYQTYLDDMDKLESQNTGLFLAGNFRGGVSVPDCITHGFEAAEKVENFLQISSN